jgi:RNA polymerase sigma-70 factor (ECF subfamily)
LFFRTKVSRNVDDLVQETLLGCLEGRDRWSGDAPFRSYVFGVARNVLSNHFRRTARLAEVDLASHTAEDLAPGPRSILLARAEDRLLLAGLRRLPARDQIVLELYFWEQMTAAEVAAAMGAVEPTIRTWIRRAKIRLEAELEALVSQQAPATTRTNLDDWVASVRAELVHK